MIPEELLKKYNGKVKDYESGDFIYEENTECQGYFQIISGKVKLNNYGEDGKEFIQNIFEAPQSFGEAVLYINEKYPANAIALTDCTVVHLSAEKFFLLLKDYPDCSLEINKNLSRRLYYKMVMSQHVFSKSPSVRLKALMDYFKNIYHMQNNLDKEYLIPLTRQQMADLTGLRVETVIRTIKSMEKDHLLIIKNRQIYY